MPQQIEVPGMGVVEFPDGMSDDQISAAIKQNMPQQPTSGSRGIMDQLLGIGGPRYQTWPERLGRDLLSTGAAAVTLPGDVAAGKIEPDASNPEFIGRLTGLAAASPVNPAVRAGDRAITGTVRGIVQRPQVPTTQELLQAGKTDLEAFKNSGLEVKADSVTRLGETIRQKLYEAGIHPVDAPQTYAKLDTLANAPPGSFATASNLASLRQSFGHTAQNFNPQAAKDQAAASRAIAELDRYIPGLGAQDVLAGTPSAAAEVYKRGRGNYAAAQRSNDLTGELDRAKTGIIERAEGRAQAANSGRNIDNTLRQKVEGFIEKPKEVSGLTDDEIALLEAFVKGGSGRNAARYVGNLMGGGGGLGQAVTGAIGAGAGGAVGGWPGAAIGALIPAGVGAVSKSVANTIAKRDLRDVAQELRKRSPLYQERKERETVIRALKDPELRAAMLRGLLLLQQNPVQQ